MTATRVARALSDHGRRLVVRLGMGRFIALGTLFAVLCSAACTAVLLAIAQMPHELHRFAMSLGIAVPALISPPLLWLVTNLAIEAERARRLAEQLAVTDALTGVHNRRHFIDAARTEIGRALRAGQPVALLLLDIDRFKQINDTHGHAAGDVVLGRVAAACAGGLRAYDLLARLGGEEFVVLMPAATPEVARQAAERLREAVRALEVPAGAGALVRPTVSIGVASLAPAIASVDALLDAADRAMYAAKQNGRDRVCVFDA